MLKELNSDNFNNETKTGLKLVEFFAPWCSYCNKQNQELQQMDKIWIGQVNTDNNAEIAIRYGIHSFPTFLVFDNGKEMERFSGFHKKENLMNILMKYLIS